MAHRVTIGDSQSVNAINLIPLVFADDAAIKEAHRSFMEAAGITPFSQDRLSERYRGIVERVARNLGLAEKLSLQEIDSPYAPKGLTDRLIADAHELQQRIEAISTPERAPSTAT